MKKDYYEILGVAKDAAIGDIKKKYRSLALQYHPDRVPEDKKKESEEKFKEISEAYGVLSDPQKRQLYDQHGHAGIDQNFTAEDIFRGGDFEGLDLGDILGQMFGGGGADIFGSGGGRRSSQRSRRGLDIQYEIDISLDDAYKGISRKIKVPRNEFCGDCKGTGAKNGTKTKTCKTCQGRGQVIMSSGFFRMQQTCHDCGGRGQVIVEYCPTCQGKGAVKVTRNIDVTIPAGVDNNSRLRVRNEGEVGSEGNGDLYLYIHVLDNPKFHREGNDIYMEQLVSFVKATLGGEISVETLSGSVAMKIPAGTPSGKMFRLKEKGMPDVHSQSVYGDQYVKVTIDVPTRLTPEQRKILEDFAKLSGEDVSGNLGDSIKEKIKKVFK